MKKPSSGKAHEFGGDWTSKKLEIIAQYLTSYSSALKKQRFLTMYVDAFAGTGYRAKKKKRGSAVDDDTNLIFPAIVEQETQLLLDGSARIALNTDPRFSKYVFIDRSADHCAELEKLRLEFPAKAADIAITETMRIEQSKDSASRRIGARIARCSSSIHTVCSSNGRRFNTSPRRRRSICGFSFRSESG